jgi:hypothetical protein
MLQVGATGINQPTYMELITSVERLGSKGWYFTESYIGMLSGDFRDVSIEAQAESQR